MSTEKQIVLTAISDTKQFRKDLDAVLQNLKLASASNNPASNARSSRERNLSITKIQEAIMWLGMDLKAINDENPQPRPKAEDLAKDAYHRYGSVTDFKNFRGDPMPAWEDLGERIQQAWIAAATPETSIGNPYPQSYNPASPVIEPTADGLKL